MFCFGIGFYDKNLRIGIDQRFFFENDLDLKTNFSFNF
ncbi:hypothetical protein LEP1GSC082_2121 [Leptospira kirschneri str. H2]|uniref:Uncharacterized protein n=2 Tax=Leptospira kirschneri TaxID=29507 RepID=A0A0E2B8Y9_9LEPT|nr:hypothetical protein LEP1GSC081_0096 [Leptospira kirschneri str. H1]EKO58883.1 hypothetical protein LEP1GSC082_2121 [Leptospira kirschneri str. H2]EMK25399.1 hypothetical protein LEP1GSC008_1808 [Leptospira kirschneri serovar Bulgarica str. Nikolaevo]